MKKFVIINAVPVNGGDEALLEASVDLIRFRFPDASVEVLCHDPAQASQNVKGYSFDHDWEYVKDIDSSSLLQRIIQKGYRETGSAWVLRAGMPLMPSAKRKVLAKLMEAEIIFSSAGGYIHDFYDFSDRLDTLKFLLSIKKKIILLPQSIGPFWKQRSIDRVAEIFPGITRILVREGHSFSNLKKIEQDKRCKFNTRQTTDVAFYLHRRYLSLFTPNKTETNGPELICCFRKWGKDENEIRNLAVRVVTHLIDNHHARITFLSTCQGIPDYVDDSSFAEEIRKSLPESYAGKITILNHHVRPAEFIREAGRFNGYIGMRLHGSILSMLAGTPAFNIAYEDKSPGIYKTLDLPGNCLYYNEPAEKILAGLDEFMKNRHSVSAGLGQKLNELCSELEKCFEEL